MPSSVEAAARIVIRSAIVLFTGVVLLLAQSVFWNDAISLRVRFLIISIALLAFFRPQQALLVLAGLAPLAQVWTSLLESRMRGGEAMVLGFLAGALMNGWTLGKFRSFPSGRLQAAAAVFGAVIAASCLEQLWLSQIQLNFPGPFLRDTVAHLSRTYFIAYRGYEGVFRSMLLIEGLALLVCVSHYCQTTPAFGSKVIRLVVISAAAAATINLTFFGMELIATGEPLQRFYGLVAGQRWSSFIGDENAAGSFFALGMLIAFGLALSDRAKRTLWWAGGTTCALALWITGSRTAVVAVFLVAVVCAMSMALGRSERGLRAAAFVAGALALATVLLARYFPGSFVSEATSSSVYQRWLFLGTTWRMLMWQTAFGVGIGQYALWSYHFAAPEMLSLHARENAHNNFAQVAGELGVVGFVSFVLVLTIALWSRRPASLALNPLRTAVTVGLAAFMLTWLAGHPLLVAEVAYPFWIALGVAAGLGSTAPGAFRAAGLIAITLAALLISVPLRVENKTDRLDFSRVRLGFSRQHIVSSRARFFVHGDRSYIALPVRALGDEDDGPVEVDVFVNERLARSLTLSESGWRSERVDLHQAGSRRFHQIDLQIRQPAIPGGVNTQTRRGIQVGDWEMTRKPIG